MPLTTLALVPARSGSKGIPGKNTRMFGDRPLLAWAIVVGRMTCSRTCVSTDDPAIGVLGAQYGAEVIVRSAELATDEAPMVGVVRHALEALRGPVPDVVVLLQPTQPFRTPLHVRAALALLESSGADSVASVVAVPAHQSPEYAMSITDGWLLPFLPEGEFVTRRQDARPAWYRDGTVYAVRPETIIAGTLYGRHCRALVIPSRESVTLDTEDDWMEAERLLAGDGQHPLYAGQRS